MFCFFTLTFKCWLYAGLSLNACLVANYSGFSGFTLTSFKYYSDLFILGFIYFLLFQ